MRIAEIQIERFGGWQNLNLPMTPGHLSVFYGPNEAGKTTLMRFVRGVFYGFTPHVTDLFGEQTAKLPRSGSLKVERDGAIVRLHRCGMGGSRGEIALTGLDQPRTGQDWLHDALRGINEKVFENVYAIGLKELQELFWVEAEKYNVLPIDNSKVERLDVTNRPSLTCSTVVHSPVAGSHSRTVLSKLHVARAQPSGLHATPHTGASWP